MNAPMPQPADNRAPLQGVPPQRGVPSELDRLFAAVDRLEHVCMELRDRLDPALTPPLPRPENTPGEDEPQSVVAQQIRSAYFRVATITERMADVLSRVDV